MRARNGLNTVMVLGPRTAANRVADAVFAQRTYTEWVPILKQHDVWYAKVHVSAAAAAASGSLARAQPQDIPCCWWLSVRTMPRHVQRFEDQIDESSVAHKQAKAVGSFTRGVGDPAAEGGGREISRHD